MQKRVMISSVYSGSAIKETIVRLSPTDIILITEDDPPMKKQETIKELRKFFSQNINFKELKLKSLYDMTTITEQITQEIDKYKEDIIFVHISEGRKTLSFAMSFAAYLRKDKIEGMYYVIEENNQLIKMPLLDIFKPNETEKKILDTLKEKEMGIKELLNKVTKIKSRSVFYKYLKALEEKTYIEINKEIVRITSFGKIALLK